MPAVTARPPKAGKRKGRPGKSAPIILNLDTGTRADTDIDAFSQRLAERFNLSPSISRVVLSLLREDQRHA